MKKILKDIKIGEKFWIDGSTMYLRIKYVFPSISLTEVYPDVICALDLSTYEILCFDPYREVNFEGDNVFI